VALRLRHDFQDHLVVEVLLGLVNEQWWSRLVEEDAQQRRRLLARRCIRELDVMPDRLAVLENGYVLEFGGSKETIIMSDPILDEIWRVREKLVREHGGLEGYLAYVQKLDRARRKRGRPQTGKKASPRRVKNTRELPTVMPDAHAAAAQLADDLLQKMRHRVAHTGYKPTMDEAREAHKLCCEAVRWFAGVGGMPVKPMLPDAKVTFPGISSAVKDAHTRNALTRAGSWRPGSRPKSRRGYRWPKRAPANQCPVRRPAVA
jgi:hypothetical protein